MLSVSNKKEYLIGVNYFSGWWRPLPNKYIGLNEKDWRMEYPERSALLGCYNEQETMDAEITAISDYGVDFFHILWYVEKPERHPHGIRLNSGLRQFIASPENGKMKFAIEFCNHPPFEILEDKLWLESCYEWVNTMKHPSYLSVGGKHFFKFFSIRHFLEQCNGNIVKAVNRVETLKSIADKEGVGPLLLSAGVTAFDTLGEEMGELINCFNLSGTYMDVPDLSVLEKDYPYECILDFARDSWEKQAKLSRLPYMPFLPSGWNPRPWGDPRPSFILPDEEQWKKGLKLVKSYLNEYINLRMPDGTAEGQKAFTIYAWNEFGEGGIVAPTAGDGWMKLKCIKEIFS